MPGFEHADAESIAIVEDFLRQATGEPVALGSVRLATGWIGRAVASVARARAITFGPLICFARSSTEPHAGREVQSALERFGGLFVHECAHVWQWRRAGWTIFLRQYLKSYFSGIWSAGSMSAAARLQAYAAIPFEREAFRVERAWQEFEARHPAEQSRAK